MRRVGEPDCVLTPLPSDFPGGRVGHLVRLVALPTPAGTAYHHEWLFGDMA